MKRAPLITAIVATTAATSMGWAQTSPQELEPGVRTSTAAQPIAGTSESATPARGVSSTTAAAAEILSGATATRSGRVLDRVELENTQITGNRELPRVMYVVPWKKPDLGEFAGRPPKSLLDELLTPVDRDVFRRQNRYYAALQPDTAAAVTPAATAGKESTVAPAPRNGDEK